MSLADESVRVLDPPPTHLPPPSHQRRRGMGEEEEEEDPIPYQSLIHLHPAALKTLSAALYKLLLHV